MMFQKTSTIWVLCTVAWLAVCYSASAESEFDTDLFNDIPSLDDDFEMMRNLLQATTESAGGYGNGGGYGGYGGGYGGYGGYGASSQSVGQQCTQETRNSNFQVYVAVLEPVQPLNNIEVAQDAPSGTVTLFVDSRTGDVYATGDIMDIHNLTSVAISAGNTSELGPAVLPLLPSATSVNVAGTPTSIKALRQNGTLLQTLYNATMNKTQQAKAGAASAAGNNGSSANASQGPQVTIQSFDPPLPYLTHLAFSQKVNVIGSLPLLANATAASNATNGTAKNGAAASNGTRAQVQSSGNPGSAIQGTANSAENNQQFKLVNLTQLMQRINETYNFSSTANNNKAANGNKQASAADVNAKGGNASVVTTNIAALMNAGLTYVSVWTAQGGNVEQMRGQLMKYGNVSGASPNLIRNFPDLMNPAPTYNVTVCKNTAVSKRGARGNSSTDYTGSDVNGADVIGNGFTQAASQVFPLVANALPDITSRNNLNGNYSIFAAAVRAANADVANNSAAGTPGNTANTNSGNSAGRRLQQQPTGAPNNGGAMGMNGANNNDNKISSVTVFAPTDAAFGAALKSLNLTAQQLLANRTLLLKVLAFHIVPNQNLTTVALAKTSPNNQLKTLLPYNMMGFKPSSNGGNATLYGQDSSASIVDANVNAGKVTFQGINRVLLPPSLFGNAAMNASTMAERARAGGANAAQTATGAAANTTQRARAGAANAGQTVQGAAANTTERARAQGNRAAGAANNAAATTSQAARNATGTGRRLFWSK